MRPAPLPAGPVHPRRRLPSAGRRLRGRGGHAPRSCHLRLALGLADPSRPLRLSRRRNGTTVSVPAGSDPAGRVGWQLSVKRTRYKPQRRESRSKSFIVLLNCFCFLMAQHGGQAAPRFLRVLRRPLDTLIRVLSLRVPAATAAGIVRGPVAWPVICHPALNPSRTPAQANIYPNFFCSHLAIATVPRKLEIVPSQGIV